MTLPVQTMAGGESDKFRSLTEKIGSELRVAAPGIIQSYNAGTNTATVQLAIREKVNQMDGTTADTDLPLLLDCPVMMPRGGGFALTFPVAAGDECLVVFADACIDSWWQPGDHIFGDGVPGVMDELERRQHQPEDRRQRLADLVGCARQILLQVVGVVVYRLLELGQGPLEIGEEEVGHPLAEILQGQPEAAHLEHNAADFF